MRMLAFLVLLTSHAWAAKPLNIITILTDDQGFGDNSYNCFNRTGMCAQTPALAKLAASPHTAIFHRFYSAAGVCSPTRASILTGRTNKRSCINNALPCDNEDPAPTCSQGSAGALPFSEFTTAKAAKKSKLGDYMTFQMGKWHLGDLWDKGLPNMNPKYRVSSPSEAGFDQWITTQAEASNSMPNCGCFPVNHTNPGPKPPSGYSSITPHGDKCVVGGGYASDWCYPCTNYYYPNASDVRKVTDLQDKVPGDDSTFLLDTLERYINQAITADRPFYAHLCMHSIHEPHPAMPEFYDMYARDPDYLGALTMMDRQIGRLFDFLQQKKLLEDTVILFTADNGPHQGEERTDIHWSTNFLRQCKQSNFEGGIRVPGFMHAPRLIKDNQNITTPVGSWDFLPTIMQLLEVESDNPSWVMDGMSLLPYLNQTTPLSRPKPMGFNWGGNYTGGGQIVFIDNDWKLINTPAKGQCDYQLPYSNMTKFDDYYLFNLKEDYNELHDLKSSQPDVFQKMKTGLENWMASVQHSQLHETDCRI